MFRELQNSDEDVLKMLPSINVIMVWPVRKTENRMCDHLRIIPAK